MAIWRNTLYQEMVSRPASPLGGMLHQEGASFKRVFDIIQSGSVDGWTGQNLAALDFLGYSGLVLDANSNPYVSRSVPHFYPLFDATIVQPPPLFRYFAPRIYLWAQQIEDIAGVAPTGFKTLGAFVANGSDIAQYQRARFTIRYETLQYGVFTDVDMVANGWTDANGNPDEATLQRYVTKRVDPSAEYLSLPQAFLKYVGGLTPQGQVAESIGKIVPKGDVILAWEHVPETCIPYQPLNPFVSTPQAIDTMIGKVNLFDFPGNVIDPFNGIVQHYPGVPYFPAGTLLLVAAPITPIRNPFGGREYRIEYHFLYQPRGHNCLLFQQTAAANGNPPTYGYGEVSTDGKAHPLGADGTHIYDADDFRWLFRCPPTTNVVKLAGGGPPAVPTLTATGGKESVLTTTIQTVT